MNHVEAVSRQLGDPVDSRSYDFGLSEYNWIAIVKKSKRTGRPQRASILWRSDWVNDSVPSVEVLEYNTQNAYYIPIKEIRKYLKRS